MQRAKKKQKYLTITINRNFLLFVIRLLSYVVPLRTLADPGGDCPLCPAPPAG